MPFKLSQISFPRLFPSRGRRALEQVLSPEQRMEERPDPAHEKEIVLLLLTATQFIKRYIDFLKHPHERECQVIETIIGSSEFSALRDKSADELQAYVKAEVTKLKDETNECLFPRQCVFDLLSLFKVQLLSQQNLQLLSVTEVEFANRITAESCDQINSTFWHFSLAHDAVMEALAQLEQKRDKINPERRQTEIQQIDDLIQAFKERILDASCQLNGIINNLIRHKQRFITMIYPRVMMPSVYHTNALPEELTCIINEGGAYHGGICDRIQELLPTRFGLAELYPGFNDIWQKDDTNGAFGPMTTRRIACGQYESQKRDCDGVRQTRDRHAVTMLTFLDNAPRGGSFFKGTLLSQMSQLFAAEECDVGEWRELAKFIRYLFQYKTSLVWYHLTIDVRINLERLKSAFYLFLDAIDAIDAPRDAVDESMETVAETNRLYMNLKREYKQCYEPFSDFFRMIILKRKCASIIIKAFAFLVDLNKGFNEKIDKANSTSGYMEATLENLGLCSYLAGTVGESKTSVQEVLDVLDNVICKPNEHQFAADVLQRLIIHEPAVTGSFERRLRGFRDVLACFAEQLERCCNSYNFDMWLHRYIVEEVPENIYEGQFVHSPSVVAAEDQGAGGTLRTGPKRQLSFGEGGRTRSPTVSSVHSRDDSCLTNEFVDLWYSGFFGISDDMRLLDFTASGIDESDHDGRWLSSSLPTGQWHGPSRPGD